PETRQVVDEINAKRRAENTGNNNRLNLIRETYVAAPPPAPKAPDNAKARPKAAAKTAAKALPHPETNKPLTPKALGGPELPVEPQLAHLPAVVDAERDQSVRQEQLRPRLRPAADGGSRRGRAEFGPRHERDLRQRRPRRREDGRDRRESAHRRQRGQPDVRPAHLRPPAAD